MQCNDWGHGRKCLFPCSPLSATLLCSIHSWEYYVAKGVWFFKNQKSKHSTLNANFILLTFCLLSFDSFYVPHQMKCTAMLFGAQKRHCEKIWKLLHWSSPEKNKVRPVSCMRGHNYFSTHLPTVHFTKIWFWYHLKTLSIKLIWYRCVFLTVQPHACQLQRQLHYVQQSLLTEKYVKVYSLKQQC